MTGIAFAKMQSCGNDFVVIDAAAQVLPANISFAAIADRKRGIGCDQILILQPAKTQDADFDYRIINADGGEVGQCGNGARCAHLFLHSRGLTKKNKLILQTKTARITTETIGKEVRAHLAIPNFSDPALPKSQSEDIYSAFPDSRKEYFVSLSLGNPHAVFFGERDLWIWLSSIGKQLNAKVELFPDGVNVGFCYVRPDGSLDLRVYERGVGITDSCGSGAAAAAAVAIRDGKAESPIKVQMPGGNVLCGWDSPSSPIWIQAPAEEVFSGIYPIPVIPA